MKTIFISTETGGHVSYTEAEAQERWQQGQISRLAHYWTKGMAEWRPVTEYFEGSGDTGELRVLPSPPPVARGFTKDPRVLTQILVVMLWAFFAASAMGALLQVAAMMKGESNAEGNEVSLLGLAEILVGVGRLVIFIVTGIVFLRWIYRANFNARGLGAKGLSYTPGWSVGWFFVPIMCLWMPFRAVKEIWQASKNPQAWFSQVPPAFLGTWWGLWLISNILGQIALRSEGRGAEFPTLLSDIADLPLCLVALKLVKEIYQLQREWAARPMEV